MGARVDTGRVRPELESNARTLTRLAQLLQRRYGETSGRSFVMMMADLRRIRARITDDMATQPIRPFL